MSFIRSLHPRNTHYRMRKIIKPRYSTRSYAACPTVTLAFERHEPPRAVSDSPSAIIFMHGLFGSKKNNRGISKALARDLGRPVYALDLRNHGESPHHRQHDYIAMANDVAGFINEEGLQQTTLIGHSMGAKTAMTLALQSPDLIHNIISVDNAPLDAALMSKFGTYIEVMKRIQEANVTKQAEANSILEEYEESSAIRAFLLGNLRRPLSDGRYLKFFIPLDILGSSLDTLGEFPFKDPRVSRFEKPALFIRGLHSRYVPDKAIPLIRQFFPNFKMTDLDAGHWVISEQPEAFRYAVVDFLKSRK